jgi:DNA-directed RNA polymerase specialized sigma24 family protein
MTPEGAIIFLQSNPNDPDAWRVIYAYMQERLNNYVTALICTFDTNPKESPRDLVHDALCGFWERWPKIKKAIPDLKAASAYLKASCRNSLVDRYRHERGAQPLLDFLTLKFSQVESDSIVRKLLVKEVIARLGGECGALLQNYIDSGLSLAEMADRDGFSPSGFYSRWYRCLERARDFIEPKKRLGLNL